MLEIHLVVCRGAVLFLLTGDHAGDFGLYSRININCKTHRIGTPGSTRGFPSLSPSTGPEISKGNSTHATGNMRY